MDGYASNMRGRPSGLHSYCNVCNSPMAYNPNEVTCWDCHRQASHATRQQYHQSPYARDQQHMDYNMNSSFAPGSLQRQHWPTGNSGFPIQEQYAQPSAGYPMSASYTPTNLQRQAWPTSNGGTFNTGMTAYTHSNAYDALARRAAFGSAYEAQEVMDQDMDGEEGGDEFFDAHEDLAQSEYEEEVHEMDGMVGADSYGTLAGGSTEASQGGLRAVAWPKSKATGWVVIDDDEPADSKQDMSNSTFEDAMAVDSDDESGDEDDGDVEDVLPSPLVNGQPKNNEIDELADFDAHRKAKAQNPKHTEPNSQAISVRSTPTPPSSPGPPDPVNGLSPNLKVLRNFHIRAKEFIPRLPLQEHRYWIGVLNIDRTTKNFSKEKHFTWMKGNRFTTVATVWHTYQNTTATEEFTLLLGREKVEFTERVEELDYFGDMKVIFRAVEGNGAGLGGRRIFEGVIPKVEKEKVEVREVIVID